MHLQLELSQTFLTIQNLKLNNAEKGIKNEEHIFWDGGFRSNTPLREVIQAHRDYWLSKAKEKEGNTKQEEAKEDIMINMKMMYQI